jgi:hypothetical protein
VATILGKSSIYTWNVYRDVEVMSRVPPEPGVNCLWSHPPSEVKLGKGEIAMPRGGGSATVDGVNLSMTTNQWIPEDYGRRYVVFAVLCSDQVMLLPFNGRASFVVDERGVLSSAPSAASFRYQKQGEELGTLERLLEYRDKVMGAEEAGNGPKARRPERVQYTGAPCRPINV